MNETVQVKHCDFMGAEELGASCSNKIGTLASSGARWKEEFPAVIQTFMTALYTILA